MKIFQNKFLLRMMVIAATMFNMAAFAQTTDTVKKLSALEFSNQLKDLPAGILIDARTKQEFNLGHLKGAANYNVLAPEDFDQQIATLDKSKPVFVYCQSGKRSTVAAAKLHKQGFSNIFELNGGIKEWRESKYAETTTLPTFMTKKQFENILDSTNTILVEFYDASCTSCEKVENVLTIISKKIGEKVTVIRINADENAHLMQELFVGDLPVLHVYKNKKLTWVNTGSVKKREILKQLK